LTIKDDSFDEVDLLGIFKKDKSGSGKEKISLKKIIN
jgi:hypothetical protein